MPVKANTFIWVHEPTEVDEKTKRILDNIQDTDNTSPLEDTREKLRDKMPKKALHEHLLSKDGTLRLEKSQYIDDMIGAEDENIINKKS